MSVFVELREVSKTYPGVRAVDRASFVIREGEILGLVGKNGAGKSTVIKMLAGAVGVDGGEILLDGEPAGNLTPHGARQRGLAFVFQELEIVPALSVAENVVLGGRYPRRVGPLVGWRELRRGVASVLERLELPVDPAATAGDLPPAQQRMVMIARALYHRARLLVLDEPSTALTHAELRHLHAVVRALRRDGCAVVYVSHRLNEILALSDRVVVMRDGSVVGDLPAEGLSQARLVAAITGAGEPAELAVARAPSRERGELLMRARGVSDGHRLRDVSLDIHAGEVLGLAGLVGSGRTELARLLVGADRRTAGSIEVRGRERALRSPRAALAAGVALLPEDRRNEGLILDFSVRKNVTLASLHRHRRGPLRLPSARSERRAAREQMQRLAISTPGEEQPVKLLSGGNQQKVVLGRWLERPLDVLIFDEPTQGIDVQAKEEAFEHIGRLAAQGRGVVLISADFSELVAMCDRVVVLREGRVTGELTGDALSEGALVELCYAHEPAGVVRHKEEVL